MTEQVQINLEDTFEMLKEKDIQILLLRSTIRKLNEQLEQKNKAVEGLQEELRKCHQNSTE